MRLLFVDTAGDGSDRAHGKAAAVWDSWLEGGGVFVTSDYVAEETFTLLRSRSGIDVACTSNSLGQEFAGFSQSHFLPAAGVVDPAGTDSRYQPRD